MRLKSTYSPHMLSKSGIQAIKALVALAEAPDGEFAGTGVVAEKIGSPQNYLGKLMQLLSRRGILVSQKGSNGGFQLARSAEEISLYDVVEHLEPIDKWNNCILGQDKCSDNKSCQLHERWKKIRESYLDFLRSTHIGDLVNDQNKKK